jgi:hypothetical protein
MARRPNYAHERAERNRSKQAKREEKEREREAQREARRRAAEGGVAPEPQPEGAGTEEPPAS